MQVYWLAVAVIINVSDILCGFCCILSDHSFFSVRIKFDWYFAFDQLIRYFTWFLPYFVWPFIFFHQNQVWYFAFFRSVTWPDYQLIILSSIFSSSTSRYRDFHFLWEMFRSVLPAKDCWMTNFIEAVTNYLYLILLLSHVRDSFLVKRTL